MPTPWNIPNAPVSGCVWHAPHPRGAVLLLHGLGEYAGRYVQRHHALIPALLEAGFTVYAYDQRGHGESAGTRAVVDAEELVSDHLAAREALRGETLPLFLFGHSLGGLISAASAARDPRGLSGVILSSPALLIGEREPALLKALASALGRLLPALPVTELSASGLSRLTEEVSAYQSDLLVYQGRVRALTAATMLHLSASLWPQYARWRLPVLIFHGSQDTLAEVAGSRRFWQTVPVTDKTYKEFEGGYHELLNDEVRDEVRALIVNWLRQRVGETS